jgi:hypothetical protein
MTISNSNNISTNRTAIGDVAVLRDDELDAVTGGADVKPESTTLKTLSSVINNILSPIADAMKTAARAG